MISSSLVLALAVAASNPAANSREAFARCIKDVAKTQAATKADAATFSAALSGACKDQEAAFKSALLSADLKLGMSKAASEKAASEQIADYRLMAKEEFEDSLKTVTTP